MTAVNGLAEPARPQKPEAKTPSRHLIYGNYDVNADTGYCPDMGYFTLSP